MLHREQSAINYVVDVIKGEAILPVALGVTLLFLSAQIRIPIEPVAITLQTVGILLIGLTFERKTAIQTIVSYLGMGAIGLPMFTNFGGGSLSFLGATGGYLFGFLMAIVCMTSFRQYFKKQNLLYLSLNCMMGTMIIYACGIAWLAHFMNFNQALQVGLFPFILPGVVKIIALAAAVRYLKRDSGV